MAKSGGRIPADGRPVQAKGVGKNSKRHDLERPKTPGLHGSDLQQGDVQAMEQGQRIAPAKTQGPAVQGRPSNSGAVSQGGTSNSPGVQAPDAIDFLASQQGSEFNEPQSHKPVENSGFMSWRGLLKDLALGPGASGLFAGMLVEQASQMRQAAANPAVYIDLQAADEGLEAMLEAGVRSE